MCVDKLHSADCLVCVKCNWLAHEQCIEPILLQVPWDLNLALSIKDLDQAAKAWFSQLSDADKNKVVLFILCKKRLKVLKLCARVHSSQWLMTVI